MTDNTFNKLIHHPLQSLQWGEFRKKTGIGVIQKEIDGKHPLAMQITIHPIPHTPWNAGYFPKGDLPTEQMLQEVKKIGQENNCIYIQLEPHVEKAAVKYLSKTLTPSFHPLFTKYTFVLDLTKSEEELLANMHPKTRYNIRVAQKKGVTVTEDNSQEAFAAYLQLMRETTGRQRFYAHGEKYHKLMWETLKPQMVNGKWQMDNNRLSAHLFTAKYEGQVLTAWILFVFHDTLYYPYGASTSQHREVMASNLMMWEAIRYGKKIGLKQFDMWGALSEHPDEKDPWYGFHRFKQGYGPKLVEFIGSYDLVINPVLYQLVKFADKIRWAILRLKA